MGPFAKDVAVGWSSSVILDPVDVFYHGNTYAIMQPRNSRWPGQVILTEIVRLSRSRRLGKGLDDYCFVACFDTDVMEEAQRRPDANPDGLASIDLEKARTIEAIEAEVGNLTDDKNTHMLFVHNRM